MDQPLYLIVLYFAQANGGVASLEATNAITRENCNNMAQLVTLTTPEVPPGYRRKLVCDSMAALERVIADYDCRLTYNDGEMVLSTSTYACEPDQGRFAKVTRWFNSLLQ
jgi:hypothetical protein